MGGESANPSVCPTAALLANSNGISFLSLMSVHGMVVDELACFLTRAVFLGHGNVSGDGPSEFADERDVANAGDSAVGTGSNYGKS